MSFQLNFRQKWEDWTQKNKIKQNSLSLRILYKSFKNQLLAFGVYLTAWEFHIVRSLGIFTSSLILPIILENKAWHFGGATTNGNWKVKIKLKQINIQNLNKNKITEIDLTCFYLEKLLQKGKRNRMYRIISADWDKK